ncbi:hypothetical protein, partial [Streptomyces luteireticuli]|uniref:hypothetical protein n=1 Tax=Streptomyces luteireticuli TaxID=173858 RepID=UPI0031D63421
MRFQGDDPSDDPSYGVPGRRPAGRAVGTGRFTGPFAVRPRRAGVTTVLAAALLGPLLGNAPGAAAAPGGPA